MTIKIDGENQLLWQWDKGQRLILSGIADNTYIDLSNEGDSNAVRMTPYTENEVIYVDIPDALLEKPRALKVYAYLDGETVFFTVFNVLRRPMPEDYVPTEQVLLWHTLDERIKKLEQESGSGSISDIKPLTFVISDDEKIVYNGSEEVSITTPSMLPNPHALSINGVSYDGSDDINIETNVTVWGHYLSLSQAMADVNSGVRDNSISDISIAKVKVFTSSTGILTVMLLDNISENEMTPINVQMNLTLNGKTLSLADVGAYLKFTAEGCTIDGRAAGSAIIKDFGGAAESCYFVDTTASLTILGGSYRVSGANTGTVTVIRAGSSCSELTMEDCAVEVINTADGAGQTRAIQTQATLTAIRGAMLDADANGNTQGIFGLGDIRVSGSTIRANTTSGSGKTQGIGLMGDTLRIADSTVLADAPGCEADTSSGVGISTVAGSTVFVDNCHVFGTHSGVSGRGNLYVNGGTYTGYSHGGFYFANGPDGINYVNDAVVRCGNYEGVHDYAEPREGHAPLSAFYVGGGENANNSDVTVYMDGCVVGNPELPAFVIRATSGEQNNTVYISNSTIVDGSLQIRVDNETHRLYVGVGTNIIADDITHPEWTVFTDELYRRHHEDASMDGRDYDVLRRNTGSGGSGKSAYELAQDAGFEGTLEQWLESLKGTDGAPGADGGYYTPSVSQPDENTMQVEFTPSSEGIPAVEPVTVTLPVGPNGDPGVTPEISIGTVETLDAGSDATASITGTPEKPVLNLGIPRGPAGEGSAIAVSGASVGQTVKIAAVDTNGVPTAWEAVDLPGEKKWELIETIVVEEEVASVKVNFPEGYCDIVVNGELRAPPESSMLVIYWLCTALVDETEKVDQLAAFWDYYPENKPCFFEFRIQIQEMGGVTYYKISGTLQADSKTHRSNLQSTGWMSESVNGNAITRATYANITREIPADSKITVWGRK